MGLASAYLRHGGIQEAAEQRAAGIDRDIIERRCPPRHENLMALIQQRIKDAKAQRYIRTPAIGPRISSQNRMP